MIELLELGPPYLPELIRIQGRIEAMEGAARSRRIQVSLALLDHSQERLWCLKKQSKT